MSRVPVILFEDTDSLRKSLELLVNRTDRYTVLGAYPNCANAEEVVKEHRPQIVLMDIDMPKVNGIEGLQIIKAIDPEILVIMITVFDHNAYMFVRS